MIYTKARFFFVKAESIELISKLLKQGILPTTKQNHVIYKEALKSCENVILLIYSLQKRDFCGFARIIEESDKPDKESSDKSEIIHTMGYSTSMLFRLEWLWSSRISEDKVSHLLNPLNSSHCLTHSKDGQEISIDLGIFICKMMMNRANDKEIRVFEEKNSVLIESVKVAGDYSEIRGKKQKQRGDVINLDKSIQNIIYEEINGMSRKGDLQSKQNNIIFTNISNLQVNIATNVSNSNDKCKENTVMKDSSKKHKKKKKDKKRKRSKAKEDEELSYHSDATIILEKDKKKK